MAGWASRRSRRSSARPTPPSARWSRKLLQHAVVQEWNRPAGRAAPAARAVALGHCADEADGAALGGHRGGGHGARDRAPAVRVADRDRPVARRNRIRPPHRGRGWRTSPHERTHRRDRRLRTAARGRLQAPEPGMAGAALPRRDHRRGRAVAARGHPARRRHPARRMQRRLRRRLLRVDRARRRRLRGLEDGSHARLAGPGPGQAPAGGGHRRLRPPRRPAAVPRDQRRPDDRDRAVRAR